MAAPIMINKHITLCGMMGAGKSAIGRSLAIRLNARFTDLDQFICQSTGKSISSIFQEYGETEFRRIEAKCLYQLLYGEPGIVALGGGALHDEDVLNDIKNKSILCFIDAPLDVIMERVKKNNKRPLLLDKKGLLRADSDLKSLLESLLEKRLPLYTRAEIHFVPPRNESVKSSAAALHQTIKKYVR